MTTVAIPPMYPNTVGAVALDGTPNDERYIKKTLLVEGTFRAVPIVHASHPVDLLDAPRDDVPTVEDPMPIELYNIARFYQGSIVIMKQMMADIQSLTTANTDCAPAKSSKRKLHESEDYLDQWDEPMSSEEWEDHLDQWDAPDEFSNDPSDEWMDNEYESFESFESFESGESADFCNEFCEGVCGGKCMKTRRTRNVVTRGKQRRR